MPVLATSMATQLTDEEAAAYHRDGFLVRRGVLSDAEISRAERGLAANPPLDGTLYDVRQLSYPEPGRYTLARNSLKDPDLGFVVEHPAVVGPAAQLLGDEPRLTAFVVYDRTPGGPAIGSHNDYKRWRPVGSSMNWLFTIVPFTDFDAEAGPLYVAPGSHHTERVRPGPERPLEVGPPTVPDEADFVDPELRRGDVLFMNMHLWHRADGNNSARHRAGFFNKYCGASSPPATGYLVYDEDVVAMLSPEHRDLIAVHSDRAIDTTQVVLTRHHRGEEQILVTDRDGRFDLPGGPVFVEQAIPDWDHGNYIAAAQAALRNELRVETPWLSWVADRDRGSGRSRVYGYHLTGRGFPVAYDGEWVTRSALESRREDLADGWIPEVVDAWLDPGPVRGKGLTQAQSRIDQYSY